MIHFIDKCPITFATPLVDGMRNISHGGKVTPPYSVFIYTHIRQSRPVKAKYICSPAVKGNESISTLYTTLPHDKLKTRLKETIHKTFSHRNYG
jgi:hypothetical protein